MRDTRSDLHQTITDKIVAMLETAQASGASFPWCRPGVTLSRPTNALTKKRYNGINILTLYCDGYSNNFRSGIWATYKQWLELGAQVRKGEKASPIVFYKSLEVENKDAKPETEDEATRTIRMAKGYYAFNADQVDNFTRPEMPTVDLTTRLEHVEQFIADCKVPVTYGGSSAYYRPSEDRIQMPDRALFENSPTSTATEGLYGVLLHELGHASGASTRLNRDFSSKFGDGKWAIEELVAELCSAMLCGDLAITPQPRMDHAHYIASWLKVLKGDKAAIFTAAAKASQAAEFWHAKQPDTSSSASRQHYIDTGRYLSKTETE
ncbi:MAG: zincin-like metallopeptidase domain-containing protein [Hyphomicrobium sp.]